MIKKMTNRWVDTDTKKFAERTAHDPCTQMCRLSCKSDVPPEPEATEYARLWFPE